MKILKGISKLWKWVRTTFSTAISAAKIYVTKYVNPSIEVVQALKKFVNSPVIPIITDLIPGNIDNQIAYQLQRHLPKVLTVLEISKDCSNTQTNDALIQCLVKHLKEMHPEKRKAFYLTLASMLSQSLSDGKLTWDEAVIMVQYVYTENYNG